MKIQNSLHTNSIRRSLLIVPVICSLAFVACSDLADTAQKQATTNRAGAYVEQTQQKSDNQPIGADPDPTYEWFY